MLFRSPGTVSWLQTLLHCWHSNIVFMVEVSRDYENSLPHVGSGVVEDRQLHFWKHTIFIIKNIRFHLYSLKVTAKVKIAMQYFEILWGAKCPNFPPGCALASRHLKFLAPPPERFGPLKLKHWLAPQTMTVERKFKFQAPSPASPFKIFWLRLQLSKLTWASAPQPWF